MAKILGALLAGGLLLGSALNVTIAPQIMTPRAPVFNGPDMAENWEWRSMAKETHGWWLWEAFPDARVTNAEPVSLSKGSDGPEVGLEVKQWTDHTLGLNVEIEAPPFDVSGLGIRDDLFAFARVSSRIECRTSSSMTDEDMCYYFVAWSDDFLGGASPHFVGVVTNLDKDSREVALIEKDLLEHVSRRSLDELPLVQ